MNVDKIGLIIANGASCDEKLLMAHITNTSCIVALDGAIERLKQINIHPDVLLGDFDRNFNPEKFAEGNMKIIHAPDQNKTDLEKGIEYLIENNFKKIHVLWATGWRADHTINNLTNIARYRNRAEVHLFDDNSHVFLLPYNYSAIYTKGQILSLIPIGKVENITTKGLKYNLSNESLILGYRSGSSNESLEDGIVEVSYTNGDLIMMICND